MKMPPGRRIFVVLSTLCACSSMLAQSASLGLPRLKNSARPGEALPLAASTFTVDDLSPGSSEVGNRIRKGESDCLVLKSNSEWSRPLRGSSRAVTFVSFQLYASAGTIAEVGGARIGFTASPVDRAVQLMFDDPAEGNGEWKSLQLHFDAGKFDGRNLAMIPTLTVRLDPSTETWDLYSGSRLVADNLPLINAQKSQRRFSVRAGTEGAWITGLVMADANPLYEDSNSNGIDDVFEKEKRGALLSTQTNGTERKALAQQWKEAQRKKAPRPLHANRPMPDGAVASTSANGP